MTSTPADRQIINRLFQIRNRFGIAPANEKLALLETLDDIEVRTCAGLLRLHAALCFIRAFPDTHAHFRLALSQLESMNDRVGKIPIAQCSGLWDSGIAGTPVHYAFSFDVASWLARHVPEDVSIDWDEIGDTSPLESLLARVLLSAEEDYFDSGLVSTREWINLVACGTPASDFAWLFRQLRGAGLKPFWSQLYDTADLPLTWDLGDSAWSKTRNVLPVRKIRPRGDGMRRRDRWVKREIARPIDSLRRVSSRIGSELIDVATASLAVRHRETHHFNYANAREVYLADVGEGVSIAVFGMREEHRYPLESTMGYLIVSNGTPIGYGGASALFRQVNTGINLFDEYRGSEASYLWTQVMRVYRNLFGCSRFIVNAYQFGSENAEALGSGAFWFYYRLGYRPVIPTVRSLAKHESQRMRRDDSYRSDRKTLLRLVACDMHLALHDARMSDLFDERWIEISSMLATRELAAAGGATRAESSDRVATGLARDLHMRSVGNWSRSEKAAFRRLAPIVAATKPAEWPAEAKRAMRQLLRAKGGPREVDYARLLGQHKLFLAALKRRCRLAASDLRNGPARKRAN